jgi:molecular chaperone HtpG
MIMNNDLIKIPFDIDISRVIEVLATQIYQSPLALLRENTQNAYDAILLRQQLKHDFTPHIQISITSELISISDNGIGMTVSDLQNHFWKAGASGKNTPEAKAAGVVGTFGIGAMANFGIASELEVVTESAMSGVRSKCRALRDSLSTKEDCIIISQEASTGQPGTTISAKLMSRSSINIGQAEQYINQFVKYLPTTVTLNGNLHSGKNFSEAVPKISQAWGIDQTHCKLGPSVIADISLEVSSNAEIRVSLKNIKVSSNLYKGQIILRQSVGAIQTFRSGFGLATVTVSSSYQFGGVADLFAFEPTAGREALSTQSMQLLQTIVSELDEYVSKILAMHEEVNNSTSFMNWVIQTGFYDLCGMLRMRLEPGGNDILLEDIKAQTTQVPMLLCVGNDSTVISAHASEDKPLLVLATRNPRRKCELEFLNRFCTINRISDQPKVIERKTPGQHTLAETALLFRLINVLEIDYFVKIDVELGKMTHGLPALLDESQNPPVITIDPDSSSSAVLLGLYGTDYSAFGSMTKDFVRNIIFPKIQNIVPSSTRQGAAAFLKTIRAKKEIFELESSDLGSLTEIWEGYIDGRISLTEAAKRSSVVARKSIQVVEKNAAQPVKDVIPDVIENEAVTHSNGDQSVDEIEPAPAINRREIMSDAKLLTIPALDPPLKGYRCFLALSDKVREEKGDFFIQPHTTSIVWGGQKVLFIFQHHSGRFGLYYDIQTMDAVASDSGGGIFQTCTILLKNRIYIPIPEGIQFEFIPDENEKKRFEVKCDLLYTSYKKDENGAISIIKAEQSV